MKKIVAIVAVSLLSASAFAQDLPRFDKRQENQAQRIERGVSSGAINEREAARLEKGQEKLDRMEQKALADGQVTKRERARLQHAENVQSRHIHRQAHDERARKVRPAR